MKGQLIYRLYASLNIAKRKTMAASLSQKELHVNFSTWLMTRNMSFFFSYFLDDKMSLNQASKEIEKNVFVASCSGYLVGMGTYNWPIHGSHSTTICHLPIPDISPTIH